jgi:hypothetical protein
MFPYRRVRISAGYLGINNKLEENTAGNILKADSLQKSLLVTDIIQ